MLAACVALLLVAAAEGRAAPRRPPCSFAGASASCVGASGDFLPARRRAHLRSLFVRDSDLRGLRAGAFPALRTVTLHNCSAPAAALAALLRGARALSALHVTGGSGAADALPAALADALPGLPALRLLDLRGNRVGATFREDAPPAECEAAARAAPANAPVDVLWRALESTRVELRLAGNPVCAAPGRRGRACPQHERRRRFLRRACVEGPTEPPMLEQNDASLSAPLQQNDASPPPMLEHNDASTSPQEQDDASPPLPLEQNDASPPPPLEQNDASTSPLEQDDASPPPPLEQNDVSPPPPLEQNNASPSAPLEENDANPPPPLEQNDASTSPLEQDDASPPPPLEQNDVSPPPPLEQNNASPSAPLEENDASPPPPLEQNDASTSPLEQDDASPPPPLEQNDVSPPPPLEQNNASPSAPLEENDANPPPPLEQNDASTSPPEQSDASPPPPLEQNDANPSAPLEQDDASQPPLLEMVPAKEHVVHGTFLQMEPGQELPIEVRAQEPGCVVECVVGALIFLVYATLLARCLSINCEEYVDKKQNVTLNAHLQKRSPDVPDVATVPDAPASALGSSPNGVDCQEEAPLIQCTSAFEDVRVV